MKTFVTRSLSAIVFAAVMLGGLLLTDWSFTILFFVINAGALWEYYTLASKFYSAGKIKPGTYRLLGVAIGSLFYAFFSYALLTGTTALLGFLLPVVFPIVLLLFIVELYAHSEKGIVNVALNVMGVIYVSFPLALLHGIGTRYFFESGTHSSLSWIPHTTDLILGMLFLIWANDTFAYIGGSLIGRHKLFPSISPGKSWEGFFIGVAGCLAVSFILHKYYLPLPLVHWLAMAAIISVTGTMGDLFESMLKRNAGVKDSGSIMPGHGGFLDRFDAFIFCIPFVYTYIIFFRV